MAEVTRSVTAAAPPAAVWALLTDFTRAGEWLPLGGRLVSTDGTGAGARYTLELRVRNKAVQLESEVTRYEEGRTIAFRTVSVGGKDVPSLYRGENEYTLEPHGTGTRISVTSRKPDEGGFARRSAAKALVQAEGEIARRALQKLAELAAASSDAALPAAPAAPAIHTLTDVPASVEAHIPAAPEPPDWPEPPARDRAPEAPSTAPSAATDARTTSDAAVAETPAAAAIPPAPPVPAVDPGPAPGDGGSPREAVTTTDRTAAPGASSEPSAPGAPPPRAPEPSDDRGDAGSLRARCAAAGVTIGEDGARELLAAWAKPKPLIDERVFSGAITVEDQPSVTCKVVRLLETRAEKEVYVPASQRPPDLHRYDVGIDAIEVAEPTDFSKTSWRLILEGSEHQAPCPSGCMSGRQQCSHCRAGQVMCWSCGGSGQKRRTEYVDGRQVQRVERCAACAGSGTRPCGTCRGSGWVICQSCQGAGSVIWFVQGEIDHTPAAVDFAEDGPEGVKADKLKADEWVLIATAPGDAVPALVPQHLRGAVAAEIEKHLPNELMRKIEISALAYATVTVPQQPGASVRIVGRSRTVVASGIASKTRVQWAIAAVVFVAAIVLAIVIISQTSA